MWRLLLALTVAAACGGSSSETPWPVEPIDDHAGPAGESVDKGNIIDKPVSEQGQELEVKIE